MKQKQYLGVSTHPRVCGFASKSIYKCVLSQCIFSTNQAHDCPWYDKDLDDEMICFNCKHFLGGSDWGLACEKHYNRLPRFDSATCDKFERRSKKQ